MIGHGYLYDSQGVRVITHTNYFLSHICSTALALALALALADIHAVLSLAIDKGSYTKEEGMQLNDNHVDGEILSVTKNKYAFTEVS